MPLPLPPSQGRGAGAGAGQPAEELQQMLGRKQHKLQSSLHRGQVVSVGRGCVGKQLGGTVQTLQRWCEILNDWHVYIKSVLVNGMIVNEQLAG